MGEIKDVGVGKESELEEERTLEPKETQKERSLKIFSQSDQAIQVADEMLRGFELKLEDEEARPQVTGPTGVVLGTATNMLLDSVTEENPDIKARKREVGLTSLAEVGVASLKTLFAGERKRRAAGKNLIKRRK